MMSLMMTIVVQAMLGATDPDSYAAAHRETVETGKPMVVMVGTDWCPPCRTMKKTVLPRVRENGLLCKVAFAVVNADRDRDLAEKLTGGGPIPQLVMFRKTSKGWLRDKLIGGQSVEAVERFIADGLAKDKAGEESAGESEDVNAPPSARETAQRGDALVNQNG